MDTRIEDYLANAARFTEVVNATGTWDGPSPCRSWTTAHVLDHVIATQRDFLTERGARFPALPDAAPDARWRAHLDGVQTLLADEAWAGEEYDGYFGRTTVADTLSTFYGFDMLVHRWDLARAVGSDVTWTDAEMDALETNLEALSDNLYTEGVCKGPLEASTDAPRQERILARLGRRP